MGRFSITNVEHVKAILRVFARLDDIRWSESPNYNLINYSSDDLKADEKLLSHWLSYISDRQMPFMRVWEIGGYVISHLVRKFERSKDDVASLAQEYVQRRAGDASRVVLHSPMNGPNRRLELQGVPEGPISFASRYIPEDAFLIFRTLALLELTSGRRLGRFVSLFVPGDMSLREGIGNLAVALDGLTYSAGGTVSVDKLQEKLQELPDSVSRDAQAINSDPSAWLESKRQSFRRFERKRLWCSLRDYLKSPEFNPYFVCALADAGVAAADRWRRENPELRDSLDQLELPGDVWNNNEVFANGLFMPHLENKRKTWNMPRTVREIYSVLNTELRGIFYPEQLDVTFDFVPRMCERQMCRVCPFGGGVTSLCHCKKDLLCPVPLVTCGYQHRCQPTGCELKSDAVKGMCQHWKALVEEPQP